MDGENGAIVARFVPKHTAPTIACFQCGRPMEANGSSRCKECLVTSANIIDKVPTSGYDLTFCRDCGRVAVPPSQQWVLADRESRELMAILLKRVPLTSDLQLVDAQFLWTEPHSRRIRIRLTLRTDQDGVTLEQSVNIEFMEHSGQCRACAKSYTAHKYVATVQIRQKNVQHKKTILWLEQLILRSGAHHKTMTIAESRDGIDFHYAAKADAEKMVSFVCAHTPAKSKVSSEMISEDTHSGKKSFKWAFSIDIAPICRDDLVVLPQKLANQKGGMPRLCLVYKLNNSIHLIDFETLTTCYINAGEYWRTPFTSVDTASSLREFIVLDVEQTSKTWDKFVLADVTVAPSSDLGQSYLVRSHLGALLHAGDYVLGYDLTTTQYSHVEWDTLNQDNIPDIVIVKKIYPDKPKTHKKRERMAAEYNEGSINANLKEDELDFLDEMDDDENDDENQDENENENVDKKLMD